MWNEQMTNVMNNLAVQLEATFEPVDAKLQEINAWFQSLRTKTEANNFDFLKNGMEPLESEARKKKRTKKLGNKPRTSRAASKAAVEKINTQLNQSLSKKLRRPSDGGMSEASMDFTPTLCSTVMGIKPEPDFFEPKPSTSKREPELAVVSNGKLPEQESNAAASPVTRVKEQVKAFEKLNHSPFAGQSSEEEFESLTPKTPFPPTRMTRSKARRSDKNAKIVVTKPGPILKEKRQSLPKSNRLRHSRGSLEKISNEVKAPASLKIVPASTTNADDLIKKKKEELLRKQEKEDEARKKKQEILLAHTEEARKRREEKRAKAAAVREAAEKSKQEALMKAEKEKEERKKLQLEREEKQKEEQAKKRNLAAQKAAETEERRRQEEAARQARLREVAEEQKRAAAMKLREQEEATAMKRKLEEAKQVKKPVTKKKEVNEYKCTPTRDERPLKKPKTEEDYGLEDASASDSSEDESNPKKEIPSWAQPSNRNPQLELQIYYPSRIINQFMQCKKSVDLSQIFKASEFKLRSRTSSAVWTSPLSTTFCKK